MELIYKEEAYKIIGICEKEKEFKVAYKDIILAHNYFADYVVFDKIILEVKATECLNKSHKKQCLNYLAASKLKLALLINFGEGSLKYERVIL